MSSSSKQSASLLKHFENLEDPRTEYLIEHRLLDIIGITICAVICPKGYRFAYGADSWVEIEEYGNSKWEWLKGFLELPNGIPSHDTIVRLFAQLDPEKLQSCFLDWIKGIAQLTSGEIIAIDGKTVRHSYDRGKNQGAIHMVSAWANQNRLVLGQIKVDEKSNEMRVIPQLLEVLEIKGCIITIDAMGTQKEIAQTIINRGGDYVLSLKGNQGNIHEDVQQLFDWARKNHFKNIPHESYQTINKDHGRIECEGRWGFPSLSNHAVEIRRYWLLESVEHLIDSHLWSGLKRVGLIESERRVKGKPATIEQRYYLLSLDGGVEGFAHASRSHWGIENQLHWCLDVAFNEDNSRIRSGYAPENMTLIRHVALNLLAQETSLKVGKKAKRLKAGWDDAYLSKVLAA